MYSRTLAAYIGPLLMPPMAWTGTCLSTDHGPAFDYVIGTFLAQV